MVRGATDWGNFTPAMHDKLIRGHGLQRNERWGPRRFVACVVCAERHWSEELIPTKTLKQFEFAQRKSKPHQEATCRKADVEDWVDGETPDVFQNTYLRALTDTLERLQSWPGFDALQAG